MKYIERLQAKPLHHRKRIAVGTSAAFTLIIALFWVSSFSYFNSKDAQSVEVAQRNTATSPFKIFKRGVASVYGAFSNNAIDFGSDNTIQYNATPTLEYVPE